MKKDKIIFWVSTGIVSLMMLLSAYSYLTNEQVKQGFVHLGYPNYFRIELAFAKIIGSLALLIPLTSVKIKEFAYTGFTIVFCSAFIAHLSSGDPFSMAIMPIIFLGLLILSNIYFLKLNKQLNNN